MELPYKVHYKILDPHTIFNYVEGRRNMKRRMSNVATPKNTLEFFFNLEKSILEDGVRNPIVVLMVKKKKEDARFFRYYLDSKNELMLNREVVGTSPEYFLVCVESGGSRLLFTQKHNIPTPCLIVDFCDKITDGELVNSAEEALNYYQDKPNHLSFETNGIFITGANHYHMKKN